MVRRILLVLAATLLLFSCSGLKTTPAPAPVQIEPSPSQTISTTDVETIGDMAVDLYILQRSYDSLMSVKRNLEAELIVGETIAELKAEQAPVVQQEVQPTVVQTAPEIVPEVQPVAQPVVAPVVQPQVVAQAPVVVKKQEAYMLVFGSFSTFQNASVAIREFSTQYPVLKDRVSMVPTGDKYRVGFVDFSSRESAIIYKEILIKEFPEFTTAWPCKLDR